MNASRASVLCLAILGAPWVRLILHRQARWCPHVLNLLCNWGALSPTPCLPPCYALVFSTLWFPTPSLLHPTSLTPTLDSFPTSQPLSACDYVATLALSSVPPTRSAYTYLARTLPLLPPHPRANCDSVVVQCCLADGVQGYLCATAARTLTLWRGFPRSRLFFLTAQVATSLIL